MKSILNTIVFSLLFAGFSGLAQAEKLNESVVLSDVSRVPRPVSVHDTSPQSAPQTCFTPAKQVQLNQRIDLLTKAILAAQLTHPPIQCIRLSIEVPFNQFTQGAYLRYRPRDPTPA